MAEEADQDDKTELPTQRKLDKAHEEGDVPKSIEVVNWFMLSAATLWVLIASGWITTSLTGSLRGILENAHQISIDGGGLNALFRFSLITIVVALAIPFAAVLIAGIAGNIVQHRPVVAPKLLMPKLSRLSLIQGFKRIFGVEAIVNFLKGLFKTAIVGTVLVLVLWPYRGHFESMASADVAAVLPQTYIMTLKLLAAVVAIFTLIAIADFLYQRFRWMKRQMMTREELKQDYKETEGNPEIKAKVRQLRAEQSRRRMMANVPKASVVIMNPTHYAVALQYESGMEAPVCVAKGVDSLALRIKQVALDSDVPVVENPPLARALHATVELDQTIPTEQYQAVAEVIGYVMGLKRRRA
jgi:flagellar biosynthetic protein FlhB